MAYAIRNSNQRSIIGKKYGNNHSVYTTVNTKAYDLAVDKKTGIIYIVDKAGKIVTDTIYKTK